MFLEYVTHFKLVAGMLVNYILCAYVMINERLYFLVGGPSGYFCDGHVDGLYKQGVRKKTGFSSSGKLLWLSYSLIVLPFPHFASTTKIIISFFLPFCFDLQSVLRCKSAEQDEIQ